MAYIGLLKDKTVGVYDQRTKNSVKADWGELLFDFLSIDLKEYDELYQSFGEGFADLEGLDKAIEKYPKTAEKWVRPLQLELVIEESNDEEGKIDRLLDFILPFIFDNQDSLNSLYKHPYIGLSTTFLEDYLLSYERCYYDADLKEIQQKIKNLIEFCFFDTHSTKLNVLTPRERYFYFIATSKQRYKYEVKTHSTLIFAPHNILEDLHHKSLNEDFDFYEPTDEIVFQIKNDLHSNLVNECNTVEDFIFWEFFSLLNNNVQIKRCQYCGKLFIPKGKYNSECCNRIPEGEFYSCKKLMAKKRRKEKVKTSPIIYEYEKAYKRMYARVLKNKISNEDFRLWAEETSMKRDSIIEEYNSAPSENLLREFKDFLGNK